MRLKDYLMQIERGMDSKTFDKKSLISPQNMMVHVGGPFNNLVETMLKDPSWSSGELEKVKELLIKRKRAYEEWEEAIPRDHPNEVPMFEIYQSDVRFPSESSIGFQHDYPFEVSITPINDVNKKQQSPPYDQLKTRILMNCGPLNIPPEKRISSSAKGILYFGNYAMEKKVPFVVGWTVAEGSPTLEFFGD